MKWSEILCKPTRIIGLIIGIVLVYCSIFSPLSGYIGSIFPVFHSRFFDLIVENIGWITIIVSLREMFWGVTKKDLKKFIPLVTMFFVVIFVYTISRQQKDILIISKIGAEGAVTCKVLIFFLAPLYQFLYIKLSNKFSVDKWIYCAVAPIVGYFGIFVFFLLENPHVVPSPTTIANLKAAYPMLDGFRIFDLLSVWPNTVYYVLCEIYAVTVVLVAIWQIINRYLEKEERGRIIGSMMIVAQISALNTGLIAKSLCKVFSDPVTIAQFINSIIIILTILMFFTNRYLFKNIEMPIIKKEEKKTGESVGMWQTIRENPVYILAPLLTVFYGLSATLAEQFWKDKVKTLADFNAHKYNISTGSAYGLLNGNYIIFQSRFAIVYALLISNIANKLPWLVSAVITPFTMLVGSLFLFGPLLFPGFTSAILPGVSLLEIPYWSGFLVLSFFKAFKYSSFDRTKEDYISSKSELHRKQIKDIEGLLGRVGKSGAAFGAFLLIGLTRSSFKSPVIGWSLFALCAGISSLWIFSDIVLNRDLKKSKGSN